jgi:hypothetical protein
MLETDERSCDVCSPQTMTASLSPLDLGGEATAVVRERQAGSSASGMASVAPEPADDGVDRSRPTLGPSVGQIFGRMWDLWHVTRTARMVRPLPHIQHQSYLVNDHLHSDTDGRSILMAYSDCAPCSGGSWARSIWR